MKRNIHHGSNVHETLIGLRKNFRLGPFLRGKQELKHARRYEGCTQTRNYEFFLYINNFDQSLDNITVSYDKFVDETHLQSDCESGELNCLDLSILLNFSVDIV